MVNPRPFVAVVLAAFAGCASDRERLPARPANAASPAASPPAAAPRPADAPPDAPPTELRPIDLASALRLATASGHDILEARARVKEAEGRSDAADGGLVPALTAGAGIGRTNGAVQGSFGDIREVNYGTAAPVGTVRLSYNAGEAVYRSLAARRSLDATRDLAAATEQRTLARTAEQYLDLVEAAAVVRARERIAEEAAAIRRMAERREELGVGPALDSERARTQAAAAEQDLIAARNDRQRKSKTLATALRLDPAIDLAPVDEDAVPATLVDPAEPLERWLERAAARRPEGAAFREAGRAAALEADAARWNARGPEVTATGLYGGAGESFGTVEDRESWNVFLGWTLTAGPFGKIEAAEARAEQAAIARRRFEDELRGGIAAAHREVALTRDQLEPADRELKSADQALALARARFEGGVLPESELLLAQQAADRARLRRLAAVVRHNRAQVRLIAEAGTASVESLAGGK